jgi:putative membrane protein
MANWDSGTGHMSGAGWLLMTLLALLLLALLAAVVYVLVRHAGPTDARRGSSSTARLVLDERFARGEIDADDYRARRELLDRGT